mmetsp:Transcript_15900/g.20062  ORF Transcript_15900/g.20062 Transcript_15900/m.20062 type:complete len:220 (+) Transcript_15900:108-767(+)
MPFMRFRLLIWALKVLSARSSLCSLPSIRPTPSILREWLMASDSPFREDRRDHMELLSRDTLILATHPKTATQAPLSIVLAPTVALLAMASLLNSVVTVPLRGLPMAEMRVCAQVSDSLTVPLPCRDRLLPSAATVLLIAAKVPLSRASLPSDRSTSRAETCPTLLTSSRRALPATAASLTLKLAALSLEDPDGESCCPPIQICYQLLSVKVSNTLHIV